VLVLLVLFATPLPRETGALIIAALLLASRKNYQPHHDCGGGIGRCCFSSRAFSGSPERSINPELPRKSSIF